MSSIGHDQTLYQPIDNRYIEFICETRFKHGSLNAFCIILVCHVFNEQFSKLLQFCKIRKRGWLTLSNWKVFFLLEKRDNNVTQRRNGTITNPQSVSYTRYVTREIFYGKNIRGEGGRCLRNVLFEITIYRKWIKRYFGRVTRRIQVSNNWPCHRSMCIVRVTATTPLLARGAKNAIHFPPSLPLATTLLPEREASRRTFSKLYPVVS